MGRSFDSTVQTLSVDTVLAVHSHLTLEFSTTPDPISPPGVRELGLLESAVHRQHSGSQEFIKYSTPYSNAATLIFGLCNNHPFHNGNKRTALVAGLMHLDRNSLVLHAANKEDLFKLMLRIASHDLVRTRKSHQRTGIKPSTDEEIGEIARWLEKNSRKIKRGEKNITYAELYRILERFGYKMGSKRHNKIEVLKEKKGFFRTTWPCVYKTQCPGDSRIVTLNEIKAVRDTLGLTEDNGIDSESFYDTQMIIDIFVREHRSVLRRLART